MYITNIAHINATINSGHKVLIYSQFAKSGKLDIMADRYFGGMGIYCGIAKNGKVLIRLDNPYGGYYNNSIAIAPSTLEFFNY